MKVDLYRFCIFLASKWFWFLKVYFFEVELKDLLTSMKLAFGVELIEFILIFFFLFKDF
jgi:hypothetical protein